MPQKPPPLPPVGSPLGPPTEPFRLADTPPSGIDAPGPGPLEMARLIRGLRQDIVLLRDSLPQLVASIATSSPPATLTPVPPSKRQSATRAVSDVAKYTTIIIGVLGIAAQIAAQFKPGLVGPIQTLIQLLGGAP